MTNPTDSIRALTILPIAGAWLCLIFAAPAHADQTELVAFRPQHVADFDSYASCVSAAQALYPVSQWHCLPKGRH